MNKGLSISGCIGTMDHSPCAGCQLLRLYLLQTGCAWGVHVDSLASFKLNQPMSRKSQVSSGVSGSQKVHAGIWGTHKCGVPVGRV